MDADDFRRLALALPGAAEASHMGHPDFRAHGRIFATLNGDGSLGMVQLTTELQEMMCAAEPAIFRPVPGGWGRRGSTHVVLAAADEAALRSGLKAAYDVSAAKTAAAKAKRKR